MIVKLVRRFCIFNFHIEFGREIQPQAVKETAAQSTQVALYASYQLLLIKDCHSTNTGLQFIYSRLITKGGIIISPKPAVNAKDTHSIIHSPPSYFYAPSQP